MNFIRFKNVFFEKNLKFKKSAKLILTVISIFLLAYTGGYLFSKNSEAFLIAKQFIASSSSVRNKLGVVKDVKLAFFGYELEYAGDSGSAEFECQVTGLLKKGNVHVKLKKNAGGWIILSGTIEIEGRYLSM